MKAATFGEPPAIGPGSFHYSIPKNWRSLTASSVTGPASRVGYSQLRQGETAPGTTRQFLESWADAFSLGGHPKPAIGGHLKSGQRDS